MGDPAPATRDAATQVIRSSPLASLADRLVPDLRASIRLLPDPDPEERAPLGATRMGGSPDLPDGFVWPTWSASEPDYESGGRSRPEETALAFVAQLRLSELAGFDVGRELPPAGFLYFFYDTQLQPWGMDAEEAGGARVLYHADESAPLRRTPRPDVGTSPPLRPCTVSARTEWTLPCEPDLDLGEDLWDAFEALTTRLGGPSADGRDDLHRVLGHAQGIQGAPEEAGPGPHPHVPAASRQRGDWRLLLQVDSDQQGLGACWGDLGMIFFLADADDIRNRRFERAWYTLQCT